MNQIITSSEAEQAIEKIVKLTQTDPKFRQLCLDNPNVAAQEATDKTLPDGFVLRFVENQNADLTVILPDLVDDSAELSDAELEQVAGGGSKPDCAASCGVSCAHSNIESGSLDVGITFTKK